MKLVFKSTGENVSNYKRSTKGYEFLFSVESLSEFKNRILELESNDYYEQEDGSVLNTNGDEVYDVNYPGRFDDCDYNYYCEDISQLDEYYDAHKIRAIRDAQPYNIEELLEKIR